MKTLPLKAVSFIAPLNITNFITLFLQHWGRLFANYQLVSFIMSWSCITGKDSGNLYRIWHKSIHNGSSYIDVQFLWMYNDKNPYYKNSRHNGACKNLGNKSLYAVTNFPYWSTSQYGILVITDTILNAKLSTTTRWGHSFTLYLIWLCTVVKGLLFLNRMIFELSVQKMA